MKQFLRKQLLNIVFLALIVAGALTIYFLSRAEHSTTSAEQTASQLPLRQPRRQQPTLHSVKGRTGARIYHASFRERALRRRGFRRRSACLGIDLRRAAAR